MRVGVFGAAGRGWVDDIVDGATRAAADGFHTYWLGQAFGIDALTALAVAGREVHGIELGTAVVPIHTRHPQALAAQALTTQGAVGGRLVLGVGSSHPHTVEQRWGLRYDQPVLRMREYLAALLPLLRGDESDVHGELVSSAGSVATGDVSPPSVLVGALGPAMLRLAGALTDGTATGETGPKTLASHIVPTINAAAEAAGRPPPRVVACFQVCVTDDVAGTRARLEERMRPYASYPSFRAMLDREGVKTGADIAIVGDEEAALEMVERIAAAGVTDLAALEVPAGGEEAARTRSFLRAVIPTTEE
jgi:5,10-methylenetetrahydromethanopterin reductase